MTRRFPFITFLLWLVTVGLCASCAVQAGVLPSGVAEVHERPHYQREAFGDGWADLDGDCQDTRQEVLARDMDGERLDRDGCKVLSGTLHDPYTGRTIPFTRGKTTSDDVQVDHIIPLSYAWRAGAWKWTDAQRLVFANDMSNLLAVDGPTNNGKGDDGPAAWMPPNRAEHCDYAAKWTAVLRSYELAPSRADATALNDLNERCK